MTYEFKNIVNAYKKAKAKGLQTVLATVVDLDGSSYRKPGVQMLILENGQMIGAVSGGCVEKDIVRQSQAVFKEGEARMMQYDGRYRLGCEGILYILLEPFNPNKEFLTMLGQFLETRQPFSMVSRYRREEGVHKNLGSHVLFGKEKFRLNQQLNGFKVTTDSLSDFTQEFPPCFRLMIFGAEHDAVQLCKFAALTGWEVSVIAPPKESKTIEHFPGATAFLASDPEGIDIQAIDTQTAVMLMSHNFAIDLKYLIALKDTHPAYLGLLGPAHRREKLLGQLLEFAPEVSDAFLDQIHGPAGLNIGAETPHEIAVAILAEILSVIRVQQPMSLKEKKGGIHA